MTSSADGLSRERLPASRSPASASLGLALILGAVFLQPDASHTDRSALWRIVQHGCLPLARAGRTPPLPCDAVDLAGGEDQGLAFLKDRVGVGQILAIATRRVSGIEDPSLHDPDAPNDFARAWRDGPPLLDRHLGRPVPRNAVGLAINAQARRSQDQLHIHVDCLDRAVAAALEGAVAATTEAWATLPVSLKGRFYLARRLSGDEVDANPFRLLADGVPGARQGMGAWSLALVGASLGGRPGFLLLADHADRFAGGHAESLQDHACAIAKAH